jgi:hypothetical protein
MSDGASPRGVGDGDGTGTGDESVPAVPDWHDEYVDRVSGRLLYSYDLEKDRRVQGEPFTLYGRLTVENRKQFLHPAISYGHHDKTGHLFVRRADAVSVADLDELVSLGEALADAWIEPDERHYETEFVFALVVPEIPESVREYVVDFESRTLLKYGYHGHYWIRLLVVAPEAETLVASPGTDVAAAFRLWPSEENGEERGGVVGRLRSLFSRRS